MSAAEDFQGADVLDDLPDFPPEFPAQEIQSHDNDVLSGRGINVAQHPGNERFRGLIQARHDPQYCTSYSVRCFWCFCDAFIVALRGQVHAFSRHHSNKGAFSLLLSYSYTHIISHTSSLQATAKKVTAQEIIQHIRSLNPPGRFLRRITRKSTDGGPSEKYWEELSDKAALKKTTQALRDCNRPDRSGYAADVPVLADVKTFANRFRVLGFTSQQAYAEELARQTETAESPARKKRAAEAPGSPFRDPFEGPPSPKRTKTVFETPATAPETAETLRLLGDHDPASPPEDEEVQVDLPTLNFGDDLFFS